MNCRWHVDRKERSRGVNLRIICGKRLSQWCNSRYPLSKDLSIDFEDSQVIARVQGSEPEPYIVDLSLAAFSDEEWDYIIKLLSKKAIYSAQLLTGQMPDNIGSVEVSSD